MRPFANPSCPLCGGPNDCLPARSGRFDTPCWCRNVAFDPDALARVPEAERNRSCLCRACADRREASAGHGQAPGERGVR